MSYRNAFVRTVGNEGRYSNHPSDRGGETMYGITVRVARANGYQGPMRDMPLSEAERIYKLQYWDVLKLDAIDAVAPKIAFELFDTAVNMGVAVAGKFLQRALNVFNRRHTDYADILIDGVVGAVTVASLKAFLAKRGVDAERVMVAALNAQQGMRYIQIAEADESQEDFEFGWFRTRIAEGV